MKFKHIIALFILAFMVTIVGAMFKLESWPYASELLIIGLSTKAITLLLLVVKLLTNKTNKTLNS